MTDSPPGIIPFPGQKGEERKEVEDERKSS
jgi:hypothetical protein